MADAPRPTRVHVQTHPGSQMLANFVEAPVRAAAAKAGLPADAAAFSFGQTPEELEAGLADAEVLLLTGGARLDDLARRAPRLRWISFTSAGVEWLVKLEFPGGLVLTNASGTHEPKAAEFALLAVLMLNNHLPHLMTAQRGHRWAPRAAGTVAGKTAMVLGMGAVGGAAAAALAAQGMRVIGNSRSGRPHPAAAIMTAGDGFRALLPETDFLIVALPLTEATRGVVGKAELDLLPPHAGVINIGRGEHVDVEALAAKLRDGSLAGALLDCVPEEPLPESSPLWDVPNLIVTPHCGLYDPGDYGPRCLAAFFANLGRFRAGAPLAQVVDLRRGY